MVRDAIARIRERQVDIAAVMRALDGAGEVRGRLIASREAAGARVRFELPLAELEAFSAALRRAAKG